ncbi:MAG: type II secretion system protein GspL [Gammaproteobacteria bacterium]|nr:type II secretion system protein GspL [Gammaproteobacteria bacterium]
MRKQLFIQLSAQQAGQVAEGGEAAVLPASWVLRDEQRPTGALFHGNLQEAAAQATGARVSVLVPGVDVVLAQVELPAMKAQRLARAVPFALEEQLASDVDDLHVAVGQRDTQGRVANAVVSRQRLDAWLEQLKTVGLQADVMTPEMFGLQWETEDEPGQSRWSMLLDGQAGLLRTGAQTGLAFETDSLLPVLQACIDDAGDTPPVSLQLTVCDDAFADSDDYRALSALCAGKNIDLSLDTKNEARSVMLTQGFDEQRAINLLQGDYSRKQQLEKLLRPWRPALMLGGLWLLFQVGVFVMEYSRLSTQSSELKEQVETVYRTAFPESRNIVNPKVQMQRGLEKLRGGGGQNDGLLILLAKTGKVLKDTPGASLRTLRFKGNKLDVDVNMPDLQSLDKLKQRLSGEARLKVEIVSASSRDGKVESRLSLQATGDGQ